MRTALVSLLAVAFVGCAPDSPLFESASEEEVTSPRLATNGVMMQGFYWAVPVSSTEGSWWKHVAARAPALRAAGIDALWMPPATKGRTVADVGYGLYDRYDLGEFDQRGGVATRYGSLAELQMAIGALHANGIAVYGDVVMNQLTGADEDETVTANGRAVSVPTRFLFPGRGDTYSTFRWNAAHFNGCEKNGVWTEWHAWDFSPYLNGQAYDNLLGCEIRYADASTRAELVSWGKWLTGKLSLDGYRIDAIKHMLPSFVTSWLDAVKGPRFAVSEAWVGDVPELVQLADMFGGKTSMFDVPLHYAFASMSQGNGAWDMRQLQFAGLTERRGSLSVSFVDNHDTDAASSPVSSPVVNLKMLAYAYILMRDKGYPCIFWKDFHEYGLGREIAKLIDLRKRYAFGGSYEHSESDSDVYAYSRTGDGAHPGLLLVLNDGGNTAKGITTRFKSTTLVERTGSSTKEVKTDAGGHASFPIAARSYAVWVPKGS